MKKMKFKIPMILLLVSVVGIATLVSLAQSENANNKADNWANDFNLVRIFRLVNGLNKEAEKQEVKGFPKRGEMLRNYFQKKTGISNETKLRLNELATSFENESERITAEIKEVRKNRKNNPNDESLNSELQKLRETHSKLFEDSRKSLNNDVSEEDSEKILRFLHEKIIGKSRKIDKSKLKKDFTKDQKLNWFSHIAYSEPNVFEDEINGYSIIEYDPVSGEIFAMAVTEGMCQYINQDHEPESGCSAAAVYAEIKSGVGEVLAEDGADGGGDSMSVEFYATEFQGQAIWEGQYCIYSQHGIETNNDYQWIFAESDECVEVEFPETPTVKIMWNGNEINDTTQEAIVGQKIDLSIAVTGGTPTNQQWTIDGEKVKNYVVNINPANGKAESAVKTDLASSDLNQSSVQFYWVDGGDNREIQYTATIDGTPYTATATFNVKRPTVNVITETTASSVYFNSGSQSLLFGSVTFLGDQRPGIKFFRQDFQVPNGFSGDTFWVQTVSYAFTRTLADNQTTQTASGNGLDSRFPYSSSDPNSVFTSDLPGACLRLCDDGVTRKKVQVQINAETWLLFKPKNLPNGEESIYVPLKKVSWNWTATATRGADDLFTLTNSDNSQNPIAEDTTIFPEWSIIVTGQEPYQ